MMMNEPAADARDMFVVHRMFRREFGLMPGLVRAVTPGDCMRSAVVADHVALVSEGLALHHQGEDDQIWPRLRERCPGECASLVDVMQEQHHAIHGRLVLTEETAEPWRHSASAGTRDALAAAIEQLLTVTREHLALEEERLVPLIEKYLTEAEYAMAAQESAAALSPDKQLIGHGMTMYGAEPEEIGMIVGHVPPDRQAAVKNQGASAYATYAAKLYGTATPPRGTA